MLRAKQLECHPDKCEGLTTEERLNRREHFEMLVRAWQVLGNAESRQRYDAALRQAHLQQFATAPIHCTLSLTDFTVCNSNGEAIGEKVGSHVSMDADVLYVAPCRCGGDFILEGIAVLARIPFAHCFQCSLVARVSYPSLSSDNKNSLEYSVFCVCLYLFMNIRSTPSLCVVYLNNFRLFPFLRLGMSKSYRLFAPLAYPLDRVVAYRR